MTKIIRMWCAPSAITRAPLAPTRYRAPAARTRTTESCWMGLTHSALANPRDTMTTGPAQLVCFAITCVWAATRWAATALTARLLLSGTSLSSTQLPTLQLVYARPSTIVREVEWRCAYPATTPAAPAPTQPIVSPATPPCSGYSSHRYRPIASAAQATTTSPTWSNAKPVPTPAKHAPWTALTASDVPPLAILPSTPVPATTAYSTTWSPETPPAKAASTCARPAPTAIPASLALQLALPIHLVYALVSFITTTLEWISYVPYAVPPVTSAVTSQPAHPAMRLPNSDTYPTRPAYAQSATTIWRCRTQGLLIIPASCATTAACVAKIIYHVLRATRRCLEWGTLIQGSANVLMGTTTMASMPYAKHAYSIVWPAPMGLPAKVAPLRDTWTRLSAPTDACALIRHTLTGRSASPALPSARPARPTQSAPSATTQPSAHLILILVAAHAIVNFTRSQTLLCAGVACLLAMSALPAPSAQPAHPQPIAFFQPDNASA